jgi:transcriptional regulator with GAF, ATPase, and Fis domain
MDKNEFFREATTRICGTLEIEKALLSTLQFLRSTVPIDIMFLQYYDKSIEAMRTFAKATPQSGELKDLVTQVSDEAIKEVQKKYGTNREQVILYKNPDKELLSKELLSFHKIKASSLLVIMLGSVDQPIGAVVMILTGKERLNQKQIEYLSLLKEPFAIALSNHRKHREVTRLKELLADDNKYLHQQLRSISGEEIIGANYGLKDVMQKVSQIANLDSPVLLLGETGVGKDVIANAIHYSSTRSNQAFITVNCGAIPESLIDSELFGHEKGAFTGAISQKRGRFERAEKGTIFLDEIGELPLQAQVRLLRVLQNKEFERVGGTETIKLDIRIIAASNRNLEKMVAEQKFREDLWFRLNVFPIYIPPLRARKEDIPELAQYFAELKSVELKLSKCPIISDHTRDILVSYPWPGNVRELQNVVERELIINPAGPLEFNHLQLKERNNELSQSDSQQLEEPVNTTDLDSVVSSHIMKVLKQTQGKIHGKEGAAELMGINASTLRNKMNKLGIKYRKNEMFS